MRNSKHYEEDKDEDAVQQKEEEISQLTDQIKAMDRELQEQKWMVKQNEKYSDLLAQLFDKGVIDSEGKLIWDLNQSFLEV